MRHDTGMENLSKLRVLHVADHTTFAELRVRCDLGRRIDQVQGMSASVRRRSAPRRSSLGPVPDDAIEFLDVLHPRRVVGEARVAGGSGPPISSDSLANSGSELAATRTHCHRRHGMALDGAAVGARSGRLPDRPNTLYFGQKAFHHAQH